jgi:hypothetical protein
VLREHPTDPHPTIRNDRSRRPPPRLLVCGLTVLLLAGCRTAPPLTRIDLSESGWQVQCGQAVWKAGRHGPELAGELLMASQADGRRLVEFSKTPLTLVVLRITPGTWQLQLVAAKRQFSGRGEPPPRSAWLLLPRCLQGVPPPPGWTFSSPERDAWRIENAGTGESLQGYLSP